MNVSDSQIVTWGRRTSARKGVPSCRLCIVSAVKSRTHQYSLLHHRLDDFLLCLDCLVHSFDCASVGIWAVQKATGFSDREATPILSSVVEFCQV